MIHRAPFSVIFRIFGTHRAWLHIAVVIAILYTGLGWVVIPARADVAPPESPPGVNPIPGSEVTQVRMVSEVVVLDVLGKSASEWPAQARVKANFRMRNLGETEERLEVRFPLSNLSGWGDDRGNFPEIADLKARVGGQPAATRRIETPNPSDHNDTPLAWAAFEAVFPPDEEVEIEVSYTADGFGYYPFVAFKYLLETGAGWKDSIGSADLFVRLPYEANNLNVVFEEQTGWSQTTAGGKIAGKEISWHFDNLEPTTQDNFEVSLVIPEVWLKVLAERENVRRNPSDGEAWGRLGKLYKEISLMSKWMRTDPGGPELYQLSREAYERAVSLKPEDALWHYGFADLLWKHYLYIVYWQQEDRQDLTELYRSVGELERTLELDPGNELALSLLEWISYEIPGVVALREGGKVDYLLYTATPILPTPYRAPTDTPFPSPSPLPPSATPSPSLSPTLPAQTPRMDASSLATVTSQVTAEVPAQTAVPVSEAGGEASTRNTGLQICGVALALPAAAVWISRKAGRRRSNL